MIHLRAKRDASRLVLLMIVNWSFGWAVGALAALALLAGDVAHLRTLMLHSDLMWQGLALLFGGFGVTFGGVVCATAVMLLPGDEETKGGSGGKPAPIFLPAYAFAKIRAQA
jgi:hypothetical protein